jgi:hypothetical protein
MLRKGELTHDFIHFMLQIIMGIGSLPIAPARSLVGVEVEFTGQFNVPDFLRVQVSNQKIELSNGSGFI